MMERSYKRPSEMSYSQHNKKQRHITTENSKLALGVIGHDNGSISGTKNLLINSGISGGGIQQLKKNTAAANKKLTVSKPLPEITDSIERKVRYITISKKNDGKNNLKPLRSCDPNVIKNNQELIKLKQQAPLKQAPEAIVDKSINPFTKAAQQNNNKKLSQHLNKFTANNQIRHGLKHITNTTTNQQAEPLVVTIDDEEEQQSTETTQLDNNSKSSNNDTKTVDDDDDNCSGTSELESPLSSHLSTSSSSSQISTTTTIYEEADEEEEDELVVDESKHQLKKSSSPSSFRQSIDFSNPETYYKPPRKLLENPQILDHDRGNLKDVCSEPHYAYDIFEYYKCKEETCLNVKYITSSKTCEITAEMRAVLVDWMVEIQESFELNHETLYLAVKIMDQYLMKKSMKKSQFQLLGITCLLVAAKFDERIPPAIDDFVYSCDSAFTKRQVIHFEIDVLKELNFFIGFPLSYRFLRRFARCGDCDFYTLTLARYILEMSLMEYDFVDERESKIAAAALFLAIEMLNLGGWNETLELYTGYSDDDLMPLLFKLNDMISAPMNPRLKTVRTKYEHKVFLEVAKVKPLPSQ